MKKGVLLILTLFFSLSAWCIAVPETVSGGTSTKPGYPTSAIFKKSGTSKMSSLKRISNRFQLKVEQWILKHLIPKKKGKEGTKDLAQTAMIISIIGIASILIPYINILSIPLAIVGLILGYKALRADPTSKKAKTAVILGWVTIGLWIILGFLVLLFISALII